MVLVWMDTDSLVFDKNESFILYTTKTEQSENIRKRDLTYKNVKY